MSDVDKEIEKAKESVRAMKSVNDALSTFSDGSEEYSRLAVAAATIQLFTGVKCKIDTTYFDYSQSWIYTTILVESSLKIADYYQVLTPKQQLNIVYGTQETWYETVKEVIEKVKSRL